MRGTRGQSAASVRLSWQLVLWCPNQEHRLTVPNASCPSSSTFLLMLYMYTVHSGYCPPTSLTPNPTPSFHIVAYAESHAGPAYQGINLCEFWKRHMIGAHWHRPRCVQRRRSHLPHRVVFLGQGGTETWLRTRTTGGVNTATRSTQGHRKSEAGSGQLWSPMGSLQTTQETAG